MKHATLCCCLAALFSLTTPAPVSAVTCPDSVSLPPRLGCPPRTALIGLGDSLGHGTMDAANNFINTEHAFLQRVADALAMAVPLYFSQPLFDLAEKRLEPFTIPTNLAVDGADIFSLAGLDYHKRSGAVETLPSAALMADRLLPLGFRDTYDKVLYPLNLLARQPVSQVDGALWLLNRGAAVTAIDRTLVLLWAGNNDSSKAALGGGGSNPQFQPLPFDLVRTELKPGLRLLLAFAEAKGLLSFAPYTGAAIDRNLTNADDFAQQYGEVVERLLADSSASPAPPELLLVTLPYYSAVGYLMDSEDLEFYLGKVDPGYTVPASFKRVAEPGEPISEPLRGDRVSLLTFGMMYALLATGHPAAEVNRVLEIDGVQRDGLVLSEAEQRTIMARIDGFNDSIRAVAAAYPAHVQLIDVGGFLNDAFLGKRVIEIDGRVFSRKWVRGSGFTLDGVHPGYTGQALIANRILEAMNELSGINAPLSDLAEVMAGDPYIDRDGDGWAPGPPQAGSGITGLLYLFKDPDDGDPERQVDLPADVWERISDGLLAEILHIPAVEAEARRRGIVR